MKLNISIHAPRMGSDTCRSVSGTWTRHDFNPRSPDGERPRSAIGMESIPRFQSTLPGWGATIARQGEERRPPISIHAPRMGSDRVRLFGEKVVDISIHAPRMGSDRRAHGCPTCRTNFNPRSPDGERPKSTRLSDLSNQFQSTLPGWGATPWRGGVSSRCFDFNPRSPDGERPEPHRNTLDRFHISIHAPRMGSDASDTSPVAPAWVFQSTLPGWGATGG